jgi:hypothetical protein
MEPQVRPGMPHPLWWVIGLIALVVLCWIVFAWTPQAGIT